MGVAIEPNAAQTRPLLHLERVLRDFERDAASHLTNGPSSDEDLARMEAALGVPLPIAVRRFLGRLGGGLFYQGHEIFGTGRVMIHDIELVAHALSVRARMAADGGTDPVARGLLPFHRCQQRVHLVELRDPVAPVVDLAGSVRYPDLATFLESVVTGHVRRDILP